MTCVDEDKAVLTDNVRSKAICVLMNRVKLNWSYAQWLLSHFVKFEALAIKKKIFAEMLCTQFVGFAVMGQ